MNQTTTESEERRAVYWSDEELKNRLHRVEGQIRGIAGMISRAESCGDILTQLKATQGALAKITKIVEACQVAEAVLGTPTEQDKLSQNQVQETLKQLLAKNMLPKP